MTKEHLIRILDEQVSVGFTGKVNILDPDTNQLLGAISLLDGDIVDSRYKGVKGLKSFFNLCVDEFENISLKYIVEPELIEIGINTIHYPYSILKRKIAEVVEQFRASKSNRPPNDLKILIKPEFIVDGEEVINQEFDLLSTISDYNRVGDIYKECDLLDYEITNALVLLRKKNALKVIKNK